MNLFFLGLPSLVLFKMDVPSDQVIQGTNDDATASKLHAVNRGYWSDSFIRYFCFSKVSKSPEISRGYFVRTQAFKAITMSFIKVSFFSSCTSNCGQA